METIDEAVNRIGFGKFHIIVVAILGHHDMCLSYQMLISALLGPFLNTYWKLTTIEIFMISSSSFFGIMFGSMALGELGDIYGRKPTLLLADAILIFFTMNTAFSPTVYWVVINQFICGFFSSSLSISTISLLVEFMPISVRGSIISSMTIFWCLGSLLITLLSFTILSVFNWRIFLLILCIPFTLSFLALLWIPESPRFLLLKNRKKECIQIINRIAKINGSEIIYDLRSESTCNTYFYKDLLHPNYLSTTIIMTFVSFVVGLTFYALILLVPIINMIPHQCLQNMKTFSTNIDYNTNHTKDLSCGYIIDWTSYKNMFISILAELVFGAISMILINIIGRKKTIAGFLMIICIGLILLNLCLNEVSLTILLFFLRGLSNATCTLCILYISEVFPTSIKSLLLGFTGTSSRLGAVLAPAIVYFIIVDYSYMAGLFVLFILNLISLISCYMLRYEPKDRKLYQTLSSNDIESDSKTSNYSTFKNN